MSAMTKTHRRVYENTKKGKGIKRSSMILKVSEAGCLCEIIVRQRLKTTNEKIMKTDPTSDN